MKATSAFGGFVLFLFGDHNTYLNIEEVSLINNDRVGLCGAAGVEPGNPPCKVCALVL